MPSVPPALESRLGFDIAVILGSKGDVSLEQEQGVISLPAGYNLVEITGHKDTLEQIYRLRVEAWRRFLPSEPALTSWSDDLELTSRQWAIYHDGSPVGAARVSLHDTVSDVPDYDGDCRVSLGAEDLPVASLNRLVVSGFHQGMGLSEALDRVRVEAAKEMMAKSIIVSCAGDFRGNKLRAMGFKFIGQATTTASILNGGYTLYPDVYHLKL